MGLGAKMYVMHEDHGPMHTHEVRGLGPAVYGLARGKVLLRSVPARPAKEATI
jgi:hypothetical protein